MKSAHMIVVGLVLLLMGNSKPQVAPSGALLVAIIIDLCAVVGFLMLIIGGIRQYREKNKLD